MLAIAERQLFSSLAMNVEALWVLPLPLIPIGRPVHDERTRSLPNRHPIDLRVARHDAGKDLDGRLDAKYLIDSGRNQRGVVANLMPLLRMQGKEPNGVRGREDRRVETRCHVVENEPAGLLQSN